MTDAQISNIDEWSALKAQRLAIDDRLKKLVVEIVKLGPGDYETQKSKVRVVFPLPKISPTQDKILVAREMLQEEDFKTLHDREVRWKPVEHFRDFCTRILSVPQVRKIMALYEVATQPYIVQR